MRIGVGLCVGTMVTELLALSGQTLALTGFMGSKRRWARELAATAYGPEKFDRVIAVDAGPWGDVWATLTDATQRARVIERLYALDKQGTARELWGELVSEAPSEDPARRVAQYLCVQSRVSNNLPVWWEHGETAQTGATPDEVSTSGGGGEFVVSHPNNPSGPRRRARCKGLKPKGDAVARAGVGDANEALAEGPLRLRGAPAWQPHEPLARRGRRRSGEG
jgi:hypothetical protein